MKQFLALATAIVVAATGTAIASDGWAQTAVVRAVDPEVYDPNNLFATIDANDDGMLSLAEYAAYVNRYAALGDVTSINIRNNDGYEGVFRHYDQNKDGLLSRDELGKASRITLDSTLAT